MNIVSMRMTKKYRTIGGITMAVALAALIGGLSSVPARADDDDRGRNVEHDRGRGDRHQVRHYSRYSHGYVAPRYVTAPPPVYYAPPPRPPVIDFVFPLVFR